jgi:hypothetical protein
MIFPPETDKTDRHDVTEILLKVVLNSITLNIQNQLMVFVRDQMVQIKCKIQMPELNLHTTVKSMCTN